MIQVIGIVINLIFSAAMFFPFFAESGYINIPIINGNGELINEAEKVVFHHNVIEKLETLEMNWLIHAALTLAALSILTGILVLCRRNKKVLTVINVITIILSVVAFAMIMVLCGFSNILF